MRKLKTAVVGLGRIGWQFHLPSIMEHEGFQLVAVVDPLEERLAEVNEKFHVKGYKDYTEMLNHENLDLVVIASPTHIHAEQAIQAFDKGVDVFMDKPIARNLEEADRVIQSAKAKGRKIMVYQPYRANRETQALHHVIQKGYLGHVYMIKLTISSYFRRNDWQSLKKYGGGILNNNGAHSIDLLRHISGAKVSKVTCEMRTIATMGDAEDVVKLLMVTENGMILDLDMNSAAAQPFPKWNVIGSNGSVILEEEENGYGFLAVRYFLTNELPELELYEETASPGRFYENFDKIPWREERIRISDFLPIDYYQKCYEYFALDMTPFVPIEETREVMQVIDTGRHQSS